MRRRYEWRGELGGAWRLMVRNGADASTNGRRWSTCSHHRSTKSHRWSTNSGPRSTNSDRWSTISRRWSTCRGRQCTNSDHRSTTACVRFAAERRVAVARGASLWTAPNDLVRPGRGGASAWCTFQRLTPLATRERGSAADKPTPTPRPPPRARKTHRQPANPGSLCNGGRCFAEVVPPAGLWR
jgi:hypothetical protein